MRIRFLKLRNKTTALSLLFLFMLLLSAFTLSAAAESIEIINMNGFRTDEFNVKGWLEENVSLSANEKIELDDYVINYCLNFPKDEKDSIGWFTIDKKTYNESSEKLHQIKSFSGSKEIEGLKNKIIILNSSIAINIYDTGFDKLKLRIWSKNDIFSEINISTNAPEFIIYQDETVNIPVKINNSGCIDETIYLKASESKFYTHKFTYDNYRINKIKLDSKETKETITELTIDKDCPPGEYNFSINASGRSSAFLSIHFVVEESTNKSKEKLAIQLSKLYVSGNSGSVIIVPVRIINSGKADLKDIGLDTKPPMDDWEIDVSNRKIDLIKPQEYETVDLTIRIPSSTESGDYFVNLKGVADNVETEETKLRVNVKSRSNSTLIGVIIIVLIIAGLLFAYKKYGRR